MAIVLTRKLVNAYNILLSCDSQTTQYRLQ